MNYWTNWNYSNARKEMKKILIGIMMLAGLSAWAQEEMPETPQDPKAQERIQNLRIAYITEKLGLTTEQAEKFWPIYREFSQERKKIGQEFRDAQRRLDPKNPDPKKQQEVLDLGLRLKERELNLEKDYSGRLREVITAQQMLNLRKAEGDFRTMLMQQLQQRREMQQRREQFRENQRLRQRN
jgi:hypothetical protein